ncbi:MAG: TonB-dependent receptor [Bacteroidetes bacterium]|nr:TonB-dependent receptor [Bacteroidota bacterium]
MFRKVWLIPTVLALCTLFGLFAALLGTGVWHWLSWIALAAPLVAMARKIKQQLWLIVVMVPAMAFAGEGGKGSVKGQVLTSDNNPAADVTVHIKGTKKTVTTDEEGRFEISGVAEGSYEIEATLVGYAPVTTGVTVKAGQTATAALQLTVTTGQLNEVVVTAGKRLARTQSQYVAKMPLKDLENPQVYQSVPAELLKEQVVSTYADALKNVPGVVMQLENNSAGGTVTSRGFSTQSWLRNGVPGLVGGGTIDPVNIERIEAIKGPSGALYGSSLISFGGLFNRVTKRPTENFGAEMGYTAGGFGLSRWTVDLNTPLTKDKTVLFRLNAARHVETSFQDAGFKNYIFAAPSIAFRPDSKTTITIEAELQREKANSFYRLFADGSNATGVRSPKDLKIDWNKHWTADDISITTGIANIYLRADREISSHWHSQTNYTYLSNNASGANGYNSMKAGNDSLVRYMTWYEYNNNTVTDIQQNFVNDDRIFGHRNRLLVGVEFYSISTKVSSPGTVAFDQLSASKPGIAYGNLNKAALLDRVKAATFTKQRALSNTYSAYVQDVFNIMDNLLAMASVRVDRFDNRGIYNLNRDTITGKYAQTAVSPKFGLIWQVVPERVSLFGNYMNGFSNIAPLTQPDGQVSSFKPSQANQWEGGVKISLAQERLVGSVSYYDIKVKDITRADAPDRPTYTVQNGTQFSRGIEASVVSTPVQGFHIVLGYAYNNSKIEKANASVDGLRPISAGPEHTGNWWLSYEFLHGFGVGFGGNYASENKVILSTTSKYSLPAYTVLGAALSYEGKNYRLSAKLDNLTNEKYWVGWSTTIPQMPARFSANLTIKI